MSSRSLVVSTFYSKTTGKIEKIFSNVPQTMTDAQVRTSVLDFINKNHPLEDRIINGRDSLSLVILTEDELRYMITGVKSQNKIPHKPNQLFTRGL